MRWSLCLAEESGQQKATQARHHLQALGLPRLADDRADDHVALRLVPEQQTWDAPSAVWNVTLVFMIFIIFS